MPDVLRSLRRLGTNHGSTLLSDGNSAELRQEGAEELGRWHFLVVDTQGIRARSTPNYTGHNKKGEVPKFTDGRLLEVNKMRQVGLTRWLHLASGEGWVFDVSPKDARVRMVEVEYVQCARQYQVYTEKVPILSKPSLARAEEQAASKVRLTRDEVVTVTARVRPLNSKGSFLQLSDDRGWVLDFAKGRRQLIPHGVDESGRSPSNASSHASQSTSTPSSGAGGAEILATCSFQLTSTGTMSSLAALAKESELGDAEIGEWTYAVLDASGITLRKEPVYDQSAKLHAKVAEGDLVRVVERRIGSGTTFLRLEEPAGWAFDVQPGAQKRQRMVEVSVEYGTWRYRVCTPNGISLRSRCSFADSARVGLGPHEGSVLVVTKRVRLQGTTFLKLRDGGGWVFDQKKGKRMTEGPLDLEETRNVTARVCAEDGVFIRTHPTELKWAQTSRLLLANGRVKVTMRGTVEGQEWARVEQQGGKMDGWVQCSTLDIDSDGLVHGGGGGGGGGAEWATSTRTLGVMAEAAMQATQDVMLEDAVSEIGDPCNGHDAVVPFEE